MSPLENMMVNTFTKEQLEEVLRQLKDGRKDLYTDYLIKKIEARISEINLK